MPDDKTNKTITFNVIMYSWIAELVGEDNSSGNTVKHEIREGTTLGGFFALMAEKFPTFGKYVADPSTGEFNDEVVLILNNRLVQFKNAKDIVLKDQDTLTLSPVLVGG